MAQEIERKFLVKDLSYRDRSFSNSHVVQGYICSARGRTVRVRIRDEKGYLTIKGPSNATGTSRYEWERELPLSEAEELMKLCEPGMSENEGLVVAEVELASEDEPFERPSFLGEEVTGQVKYYNSFLMKEPFCTWNK